MNSEWKEVKLGEIAQYSKGRINNDELTLDNYISTENMLPEKSGITIASSLPSGNAIKYKRGQILISNIRPYFKKIWHATMDGGCSADVLAFDISDGVNSKYFYYLLSQDKFFDYVMAGSKGTKMPRGDKQQIMMYPLLLPEISEQKAIADTLSCLDDKIELNNRINKTLEEMAQAIFKSWFVEFEPFQDGEFEDSELGRIPKGWRVAKIGDIDVKIADYVANGSFASLKQNVTLYEDINYAYFIRNVDLKVNIFQKYVDEHSYNFLSKTKLFGNEVIISNVGDVGSVFLCPVLSKPMTLGNNMIMISSENKVNYNFFMYILFKYSYGLDLIQSITGGSAQPKFNKTDFRSLKIVLPTDDTIVQFNKIIEKVFKKRNLNTQEIETLTTIRNSLLSKLISGEIRVPIEEMQ